MCMAARALSASCYGVKSLKLLKRCVCVRAKYVCRTELNIEGLCNVSIAQYMHLRLALGAGEVCVQRFSDGETFFRNASGGATIDVPMKNAWGIGNEKHAISVRPHGLCVCKCFSRSKLNFH